MTSASRPLFVLVSLAAALIAAGPAHAAATVVFADSFEDGSVGDWTVSSSVNITVPVVTVRTLADLPSAGSGTAVHSGSGAMWVYFNAPSGGSGAGTVRATHSFIAPVAGDYTLDLWARSAPCQGCTMSFDVLVDGVSKTRNSSGQNGYQNYTTLLTGLSAGVHTLTLGMHTTGASSGRFQASFDDVQISTLAPIPEPGRLALSLAGLLAVGAVVARRRTAR